MIDILRRKASDQPLSKGIATFLNPFTYNVARRNIYAIEKFDRLYFDGIALKILCRILGIRTTRRSFDMTSLAPIVFSTASQHGWRLAIVGGEAGVAERSSKIFQSIFPDLRIEYTSSGFFSSIDERSNVILELCKGEYELVIIGMGAPYQEKFLLDLIATGWHGIGYTCGAFLHQTASQGIDYYPRWIDKLNLRWMYRIYDEPKLFNRYMFEYPKFIVFFIYDVVKEKILKYNRIN
ncbi:N-acetylglucosaminyldiphosphoundecaprenol N-acetyl-beta-D-mannosaminyltransferase [Desulfomicrobium macestii]|uniref:N-acetylglucosaminyldiphosphoundecaprenol N-acetyl-beta-D-mannosaminyltransferase n=2 Tax=Desulfomicrobium TaxID=898 RepID=A0A8G2C3I4_DESNO|nr:MULTISPECIES: WecB/TagA/CpsF family glycosyltransferase [Desulfomicrobium]MBE1424958.1 N-acetylglucosaminyldiphosphoundecaprenol N-acetyl-beta-D-mannosaminyltransferase [Desulfomicrobium macestii]SFL82673.1 N-acetylglucosaminyldiphosphoundecaprenol N-acetyl-beta-D-mannosaminyltransferase [Desulfomicrobium norvegicum]